jgi:hypothetical protein
MKCIVIVIILFLSIQNGFSAESKTYFRADYGIGNFTSEKLDSLNANPSGSTLGVGLGAKIGYIEIGGFYKNFAYEKEINHDNAANKLIHEGSSFGLEMNILVNNHLGIILGYSFNNYTQKLETSISTQAYNAAKTIYGIEESKSGSNVFLGASIDIFSSKKWDITSSVLHFMQGDGKSNTSAQAGIKIYFNSNFSDFFGAN